MILLLNKLANDQYYRSSVVEEFTRGKICCPVHVDSEPGRVRGLSAKQARRHAYPSTLERQSHKNRKRTSKELKIPSESLPTMEESESQETSQEVAADEVFIAPSIYEKQILAGASYTHQTPIPDTLKNDLSVECVLGVDEAGRGPVLGTSHHHRHPINRTLTL